MKKIIQRSNGYVVEFPHYDRYLTFYLIKKALGFMVDIALYLVAITIMYLVFNVGLIYSFIISYVLFFLLTLSTISMFKNKTLGMAIAGLEFGYYNGGVVSKGRLLNRAFFTSIYAIPVAGAILLITTSIAAIINKGVTPIDLFNKTQVFSKYFHRNLIEVLKNLNKEGDKWM